MTNVVLVRGRISRLTEREMPSGDTLTLVDVTTPGREGEKADVVPLVWFQAPRWLAQGAELVALGRVRKRFWQANGTQSRTEVVVERGAPANRASRVAEIQRRAAELIGPD
jgi:hypothetical protein